MNNFICLTKYGIAVLLVVVALMIYNTQNFEQLKTTLIVLIALEAFTFLLIDYQYSDELCEIKQTIDRVNKIRKQVDNLVETGTKKLNETIARLKELDYDDMIRDNRDSIRNRFPFLRSIMFDRVR